MSSLYLHIPFCAAKCPYCDFFSRVAEPGDPDSYSRLLEENLALLKRLHPDHPPLHTVYFGGGTPSLLSAARIGGLLDRVAALFGLEADAEITLEANPGRLDRPRLRGYRRAGITRLSLGIQSFDDRFLELLGRSHSAQAAVQSIAAARAAGFSDLSLDLMFALPGQTLAVLDQDISRLLEHSPEHISLYGLTFEEGTEFAARHRRGELIPCDEELYREQYQMLHHRLVAGGYEHYEISNFARPGHLCRHNRVYWRRAPCLAAGCGAHGFSATGWGRRWQIPPDLERYAERINHGRDPALTLEEHDRSSAMREYLYLGLRTAAGIDCRDFRRQFGADPGDVFAAARSRLGTHLQVADDRWRLAWHDWLIYDHLISFFL